MNQKHMDSISLGVHMGLRTQRVGENVSEEGHFRSQQMPHIVNSSLKSVVIASHTGLPAPNNSMNRIYITEALQSVDLGESAPTFCSFSWLCFMSYKLWWHPNALLGICTHTFFPRSASAKMKCHRRHHVTTRCQAHIKHLSRCYFSGEWKA